MFNLRRKKKRKHIGSSDLPYCSLYLVVLYRNKAALASAKYRKPPLPMGNARPKEIILSRARNTRPLMKFLDFPDVYSRWAAAAGTDPTPVFASATTGAKRHRCASQVLRPRAAARSDSSWILSRYNRILHRDEEINALDCGLVEQCARLKPGFFHKWTNKRLIHPEIRFCNHKMHLITIKHKYTRFLFAPSGSWVMLILIPASRHRSSTKTESTIIVSFSQLYPQKVSKCRERISVHLCAPLKRSVCLQDMKSCRQNDDFSK